MSGEVYELVDQIGAVVAALQGRGTIPCQGSDGRWSVAMCLAAARSIDAGVPISLAGDQL